MAINYCGVCGQQLFGPVPALTRIHYGNPVAVCEDCGKKRLSETDFNLERVFWEILEGIPVEPALAVNRRRRVRKYTAFVRGR